MAIDDTVPVNEEENEKAATRDPDDTTTGPIDETENKDAGELEAVVHAYEASTPSYELNLDAGEFAGGNVGEDDKGEQDGPNVKQ